MDGYAVRAADVASVPATLKVDRRGRGRPSVRRRGRRRRGRAHLHRRRAAGRRRHHRDPGEHRRATATRVIVNAPSPAGRHIRRAGLDFKQGEVLLPRGRRLTDRDLTLAAAMNHPTRAGASPAEGRGARRPATSWCRPAASPARARSSIPTASRSMALARARRRRGDRPRHRAATGSRRRSRPSAARATAAPTCWSPPAAPRSATTTWCSRRSPPKGLTLSFWRVALRPGRPLMHGRLGAHARARPARQSGLGLCLRVPVPGAADPHARRARAISSRRPNRRCSARDLPENDERADYCARRSRAGADGTWSPRRSRCRTPR